MLFKKYIMSYGFYSGEESAMEKDDFYNEVYADEPSKDQILESIAELGYIEVGVTSLDD